MTPPVALAYLHPGMVAHSFMASVLQTKMIYPDLMVWPIRSGPLAIPKSRNLAVEMLLDSSLEWLWFADSDVGFPPTMLDNLLRVGDPTQRPVVTGVVYAAMEQSMSDGMGGYVQTVVPSLYEPTGGGLYESWPMPVPDDVLSTVGGCGAGMLLIHRSVLDVVGRGCFDRLEGLGEDLSFCRRLADKGIPLHVHTGLKTSHYKSMFLT